MRRMLDPVGVVISTLMVLMGALAMLTGSASVAAQAATPGAAAPTAATSVTAAQAASPVATPYANAVPCTNLFGIALGNACVIFLQASSDTGAVDVYVDGVLAVPHVAFAALGDYVPVASGQRRIQLTPSGAPLSDALIDTRLTFADGVPYEVAAIGRRADLRLQALPVNTAPLSDNTSRLRVVQASPDAPAVNLAFTGGSPILRNVAYPTASQYVDVAAGTYDMRALASDSGNLVVPLPGTVLAPNRVYSIYIAGLVADATLTPIIVPVFVAPALVAPAATPVG
jgi:hypothetical protein